MIFCWSTLNVINLDESVKFYTEIIGLKLVKRFKAGETEIAFLEDGENKTEIELIENQSEKIDAGKDISWGFKTKNLDETLRFFEEKEVTVLTPIISPTPNIRFVMILDPNGMKLQIAEE